MKNKKFIIHNHTKSYLDYEIFYFVFETLKKGLLSNNETEYCYCVVWTTDKGQLIIESNKTKTGYRIDIMEGE